MTAYTIVEQEGSKCLSKLYQSKIFSDFTIISNGKKYEVHKSILASSIPYFDKMFKADMKSKSKRLTLHHSTEALEVVIAWSYCQPITLTSDNAHKLAELADELEIPELIPHCLTFLSENASYSILSEFSNFINYKGTRKMVERYICSNFCDIVSTDEFSSFDFDTIDDILSLEDLNVEDERDVFDAIIKWIAADQKHRLGYLGELMKKIYWISVDKTKLVDVASNTYVQSCENARAVMRAAFDLIAFKGSEESKRRKLIHRPRQNCKRVLLRFDRSSVVGDDKIFFKTFDQPPAHFYLERNDDLTKKPKFFEVSLSDYNTNSCHVIRIDWLNRKFQLYGTYGSRLCCCLFGYLFEFEAKARGKVRFWKGSRCIELGQVPDDCSSLMSIAPYKGHFYIAVKCENKSNGFIFKISKFDPIKNIWTNLSKAPDPVSICCTRVMMKINNGKVSLFFGQKKEKSVIYLFMTCLVKHWIYDINEDSWSENKDLKLNSKSNLEIVKNLTNQIQCFEHQMEIIKKLIATEESCSIRRPSK